MKHRKMTVTLIILALTAVAVFAVLQHPAFGSRPKGARLARIQQSPNYRGGAFRNREETPILTTDTPISVQLWNQFFRKPPRLTPAPGDTLRTVKTDLRQLDPQQDQVVWLGHSSYLLFNGGAGLLIDPVLTCEFPVNLMMKPFMGTDLYRPDDLPRIDYLVITHDHWDHLDYGTVKRLQDRIGQVVCPLGVGAHFERWGFPADRIHEMDWDDTYHPQAGLKITCLTARHFSGRLLKRNGSLWASFMIEGRKTIFVGGDSGYGAHIAHIGRRFPHIDLAMMENGQYSEDWRHIHTLPAELPHALHDLGAAAALPVHHSKFALARHDWDEPLQTIRANARRDTTLHIVLPHIGEPVAIE